MNKLIESPESHTDVAGIRFTFSLPANWRGYSVLVQEWEGKTYLAARDEALCFCCSLNLYLAARNRIWSFRQRCYSPLLRSKVPDSFRGILGPRVPSGGPVRKRGEEIFDGLTVAMCQFVGCAAAQTHRYLLAQLYL